MQAGSRRGDDPRKAMAELQHALSGRNAGGGNPAHASIPRRLELAYGVPPARIVRDGHKRTRLATTPPFNRSSMAPPPWPRNLVSRLFRSDKARAPDRGSETGCSNGKYPDSPLAPGRWPRAGAIRRIVLPVLVFTQTYLATDFMTSVLPYQGRQPLEIAILVLFAVLFGWVSVGFWTAMAGFLVLLFGGDRHAISRSAPDDAPISEAARTAIVMPICNEDVPRVFAGLRATYESLARSGELRHFDFFVLSDSNDPDIRVAETGAWLEICRAVGGFGRIFYRWRQHRIKRKSGNIADFCRRWGKNYRYMVVLDADSVMSGGCLAKLVRLMEANTNAGIIQTAPRAAGRDTLHARVQQFAGGVYGPVFAAGIHFWQLGESPYWGHNAIIRVAPFIRHCALRRLPGRGSLSGEILSHDFVEAALMRRAGWAVWIAHDLPGSYEEMPPNLIDELKRDRRWCQGNLMNFRLVLMEGFNPAHRAVFMTGVMAYVSALLWLVSLILCTALLAVHTLTVPEYFVKPYQLFPLWPEWRPDRAIALLSTTAVLLFLPKFAGTLLICFKGARAFGGAPRLIFSMLAELVFSALLAPIRMLFHAYFVVAPLIGWTVQWKSPPRGDTETTWGEALKRHGWQTLLGIAWAGGVYWLDPSYLWWLLPVVGALILSVPLSVYSSRASFGRSLRKARFFLTPEESHPPREIRQTQKYIRRAAALPGFAEAVVDPAVNALACASGIAHIGRNGMIRNERPRLVREALTKGPAALTARRKMTLLNDPMALSELHYLVWSSAETAPSWREVMESPGYALPGHDDAPGDDRSAQARENADRARRARENQVAAET